MTKELVRSTIAILIGIVLCTLMFVGASCAGDVTINNAEEWMSKVAGKSVTDNIVLTGNIDLSGKMNPMISSLSGTFEGNGYTISNFTIACKDNHDAGLIGIFSGNHITNTTLRDFTVSSNRNVGGFFGYAGYKIPFCSFENCLVLNCTLSGNDDIGGLLGYAYSSCSFENCVAMNCTLSGGTKGSTGGILGYAYSSCSFEDCSSMDCSVLSGGIAGGLLGSAVNLNITDCINCSAMNYYVSNNSVVGGLIGFVNSKSLSCVDSMVSNSTVSGNNEVGGLVGHVLDDLSFSCVFENCSVNKSLVSGNNEVGGLVGHIDTDYSSSSCIFKNCIVAKSIVSGIGDAIGGLVGSGSSINACECCLAMNCRVSGNNNVGGIIGSMSSIDVMNCIAKNCTIFGSGNCVGGLFGVAGNGFNVKSCVINCSSVNCRVSGNNDVGGLIGREFYCFDITNCSSVNCSVSGINEIGGLIGDLHCSYSLSYFENSFLENCNSMNCSVLGNNAVGALVGISTYGDGINCTALNCNVSGNSGIGGVVGCTFFMNITNCFVVNCSSSGNNTVGGVVGSANPTHNNYINNCRIENSSFLGGDGIGGVAGIIDSLCVMNCTIMHSSLSGYGYIGGLIGFITNSTSIINSGVENCIVVSNNGSVGGFVGYDMEQSDISIKNSHVLNSVLASNGNNVGGFIGISSTCTFIEENLLKGTAIRGNIADSVGLIVGSNDGVKKEFDKNVTMDSMWMNDNITEKVYPMITIAKSADPTKQGPENVTYFNDTTTDFVPTGSILVTNLEGYGVGGKYKALAYVSLNLTESTLVPKWNVVSVPKKPAPAYDTAGELFADVDTAGHAILTYNGSTKNWEQITASTIITPLNAYWIYSNSTTPIHCDFSISATSSPVMNVYKGWNAVGVSAEEPLAASVAFGNTNWYAYLEWNAASQKFNTPLVKGGSGIYADTNQVSLWTGGWLFLNEDGTYIGFTA